jgi:hypothetical protein
MVANANTSRADCKDCTAFDLVINALVLNETISQFATRKERTLFDASGSTLSVSIEAGSMSALTFIVLHETTHMVDMTINLMPQVAPSFTIPEDMHTPFSRGIWEKSRQPVAAYFTPLLSSATWFTGKPMRIEKAQAFYEDLQKTPFPSSYAASSNIEDLPELVALNELTGRFKQPWRIEVRDGTRLIHSYEPMKSPLVRARLPLLAPFHPRPEHDSRNSAGRLARRAEQNDKSKASWQSCQGGSDEIPECNVGDGVRLGRRPGRKRVRRYARPHRSAPSGERGAGRGEAHRGQID